MEGTNKKLFIKDFANSIILGKASLFIGSGISRQSGYAKWKDILKDCAIEIGLDVEKEGDLIALAQYYVRNKQRTKINQTISSFFAENKGKPIDIHQIIVSLPINSLWTTNYDTLIERSYKSADILYTVLTNDTSYKNIDREAKVKIHKIHGDVQFADKCVITRQDYEDFEKEHEIVLSELKGEMCSNSFLFLGYSFSDTDIQHILSRIRLIYNSNDSPQSHYCILEKVKKLNEESVEDFNYNKNKQAHHVADMQDYGVNVVLVDSYDEILDIMLQVRMRVLLKNILICGAYEDDYQYKDRTSKTAYELAARLIEKGYKIYTGYGKNLGSDIVGGAFLGCQKADIKVKDFNDNVFLFPFPYKIDNSNRAEIYTHLRKNMISKTHITVLLGGTKKVDNKTVNSDGLIEEYKISKTQGNLIIPVSSTGGAALKSWDEETKDIDKRCNEKDFNDLAKTANPTDIVDLVLKIIENYVKSFV